MATTLTRFVGPWRALRAPLLSAILPLLIGCAPARPPTFADGLAAAQRGDLDAAVQTWSTVTEQQPGTADAALSHDAVLEVSGRRLFPYPEYACSSEAQAQYAAAEQRFQAGEHEAALSAYQRAVDQCPGNVVWWVHAGDAYFQMGDYERARDLYLKALQLDAWNRSAHRFLADTELRLGDPARAYRSAVLAVVSDPTYEAGWHTLREITLGLGGQWHRVVETKPRIEHQEGKPQISLSRAYESKGSFTALLAYALLRARLDGANPSGEPLPAHLPTPEQWTRMSALERERVLVTESLRIYASFIAEHPDSTSRFWDALARAEKAGLLDEAIYLQSMDADLAPSYVVYRAEHTARLVEYVATIIAPLPPAGGHGI